MKETLTSEFLAQKAFDLYQTHGVPIELSKDILAEYGYELNELALSQKIEEHQKLSQSSSASQFKSGLGLDSSKTRALHTTTHLLHQILRSMFGKTLRQMGSAITDEKARFDFTLSATELTSEKLLIIENQLNQLVAKNLVMQKIQTTPILAKEMGAIGLFGEKYGDSVFVYSLVDQSGVAFSREFCGGPHIENTSQIKAIKILKKKSIGQGMTRLEYDVEL
jgi:alanyl-tRNA synthetase